MGVLGVGGFGLALFCLTSPLPALPSSSAQPPPPGWEGRAGGGASGEEGGQARQRQPETPNPETSNLYGSNKTERQENMCKNPSASRPRT